MDSVLKEPSEAIYRNMTDREFISHILISEGHNYFAVQAALRLETQLDIAEDCDS